MEFMTEKISAVPRNCSGVMHFLMHFLKNTFLFTFHPCNCKSLNDQNSQSPSQCIPCMPRVCVCVKGPYPLGKIPSAMRTASSQTAASLWVLASLYSF